MGFVSRPVWAAATWVVASEQSVLILPYIAKQGFKWICSDEAVLGWTLSHFSTAMGWQCLGAGVSPVSLAAGDLAIVFRDHRLSDLIGFTYGSMQPKQAAADLGHLEAIAHSLKHRQGDGSTALEQPWLVTIALMARIAGNFISKMASPS